MPVLSTELRNKLEKVVVEARDVAEDGTRIALESLAVHHYEPYAHMDEGERRLRNRLRARGRQLGDVQDGARLEIRHLVREVAYEHWHRMLFARFLAENNLLIEPELGVAITMQECEELAREAGEDPRAMAARFAQGSLPQIFREGDPVLELTLPPETQQALDRLLDSLPTDVFTADDSLGWTYQFWQSKRKKEVNDSGNKIGADELPAVTQLFTEHYMVQFLYHNTIGAWHAGKVLAANPKLAETAQSEGELRDAVRLKSMGGYDFEYLRFVREEEGDWLKRRAKPGDVPVPEQSDEATETRIRLWRPAAGTFDGWPRTAKEITVLDPCCGSGHFLNEGFQLLVRLRMDEEGLALEDAIRAVLSENLHGLEIDPRCTQIAAFNVALAAWKLAGKPIELPPLHIACSGLAVGATKGKWITLAGDDPRLQAGMERLYDLFEQAPVLGSLIDPKMQLGNLLVASFDELQPLLEKALEHEQCNDEMQERAVAAQGMAKAAELLSKEYTLSITNVPYLQKGNQAASLVEYVERQYRVGRQNLATAFILRSGVWNGSSGVTALVVPQGWLFSTNYRLLRKHLCADWTLGLVSKLGHSAFETITGEVVNVALVLLSNCRAHVDMTYVGMSVEDASSPTHKAQDLREAHFCSIPQATCLSTPGFRIDVVRQRAGELLAKCATFSNGIQASDRPRFVRYWWEVRESQTPQWRLMQTAPSQDRLYDGRLMAILWEDHPLGIPGSTSAVIRGAQVWRKDGVLVSAMSQYASRYSGELYDENSVVLVPRDPEDIAALWQVCSSETYKDKVREICPDMKIRRQLLDANVAFSNSRASATEKYPNGLPEPQSDDPTQWLFHGHPAKAELVSVLQVAVGRLLGYRWPPELDPEMRLAEEAREWVARCDDLLPFADEDGIVCIPSIRGEQPAAERLRTLLSAAFGDNWTAEKERQLIEAAGSKAKDLDAWLRNDFFEQHCKLFHHRPFVWHIWDGRQRDGFHALVNYHKLAEGNGGGRRTLESLTYSYLADWIARQEDGVKRGTAGAEDRLAAALELRERLVAILEGEPPFDLFIRWKSLAEQPIGWDPDINDGVRLNARPFMASDIPGGKKGAGIFRWKPNITWDKDRGKEPQSLRPKDDYPWFWTWDEQTQDFLGHDDFDGNRWNDLHYTNKAKQEARERAQEETKKS